MRRPTERQLEVARAIERLTEQHGYPPTIRELGDALGFRSTNAVSGHLAALARKGIVEWKPRTSRTLRVIDQGSTEP